MKVVFLFLLIDIIICAEKVGVLILARGGSKGVRLKNLQKVGDNSLLCRAIYTAKAAGFADITVSTDHPLIALESTKCNATVFRRSYVTASDWAPSIWGAQEFLLNRSEISILILIQVTSPFIRAEQIRIALKKIKDPTAYDCIFTATRSFKIRWRNENGKFYPDNFDVANRLRRQDWEGELIETGAFYITRRHLIKKGQFQNVNCTVLEVSGIESLEVDSYHDLQVANALHNANLM